MVVVNTPVFLGLGVTVTETKIKKVQKQDLNIENVKDVGMACHKVYKEGRDDIIVKVDL